MADPKVYADGLAKFQADIAQIKRDIRNLQAPTESQFNQTVQKMLQIINNIDEIVGASVSRTSYTRADTDSRINSAMNTREPSIGILPPRKGGTGIANAYNNLFSVGPYRATWMLSDGTLGTSQSSRKVKTDFHVPDITIEQLRSVDWIGYRYIDDKNQNNDSALPRIGMIAEDLDDAGLGVFVVYDDKTLEPISIDYTMLSVAALHLAQDAEKRADALEDRISILENLIKEQL